MALGRVYTVHLRRRFAMNRRAVCGELRRWTSTSSCSTRRCRAPRSRPESPSPSYNKISGEYRLLCGSSSRTFLLWASVLRAHLGRYALFHTVWASRSPRRTTSVQNDSNPAVRQSAKSESCGFCGLTTVVDFRLSHTVLPCKEDEIALSRASALSKSA